MKYEKFLQHGYVLSLHRAEHAPENGFGYGDGFGTDGAPVECAPIFNVGQDAVIAMAEQWAKDFGTEYQVHRIISNDDATLVYSSVTGHVPTMIIIPVPWLTATLSETYEWSHAKMRGFVLHLNGEQLPGMFSLDMSDVDGSIKSELERYQNSYYTWDAATKTLNCGPWAEVDHELVTDVLKRAAAEHC